MGATELRTIDEKILHALQEGRLTPWYLEDRTGESRDYIRQRVRELDREGLIQRVPVETSMGGRGSGLYELTADGREHVDN